ncbi:ABC transporter ATP-binding protein [Thiosocius teredinicola]|uniref:ABC transporter ATP-binding protein n=1 Tax=Thiosocius teredinicola TaxID=1973002 RepID=UPI000991325C
MNQTVIEAHGLSKRYSLDGVTVHALNDVDLVVEQGEFVAIMGPSGSGKSTLMNILGCLDHADDGQYKLKGRDVSEMNNDQVAALRNREIGFVFQDFNLLSRTDALENVATPLVYAGLDRRERDRLAGQALADMGLRDKQGNLPTQLSGGQQQRVAIARALVTKPSLLLADEPTGNLDSNTTSEIMSVLKMLNKQRGLTVVLITHEPDVACFADRVLEVRDGELSEHIA